MTLLEIVIVLVVLLTLLGLGVTYVLRQRENALRVHCADNLRRLSTAARVFHDTRTGAPAPDAPRGYLPAARIADGYATWAVQIAPDLMSEGPLLAWDLQKPCAAQDVKARDAVVLTFFCPARLRLRGTLVSPAGDGALGDYAGVAGDGDPAHDWNGPDANGPIILGEVLEKRDDLILRWRGRVSLGDLKRGQSYTLLLGEKHVPPDGLGQARFGDGSLYDGTAPGNSARVGGPGHGLAPDPAAPFLSNFGSYHPGVCQFARADTSVAPLDVTIGPAVLAQMTTRTE